MDLDDCVFERVTAERLAQAIIGDVRVTPTEDQIAGAVRIIEHLGTIYRLVA